MLRISVGLLLLSLGIGVVVVTQATPARGEAAAILWADSDWPPWYIKSGPFKRKGLSDLLTKLIQEDLPQYSHKLRDLTSARMAHEMKSKKLVCGVDLGKNAEREEYMVFSSVPSMFTLPVGMIIARENWERFKNPGESFEQLTSRVQSFRELLKRREFRVALERDRSSLYQQQPQTGGAIRGRRPLAADSQDLAAVKASSIFAASTSGANGFVT